MNEANILKQCMMQASRCGAIVWRNNTGAYKDGQRFIRYGLCEGSSDIIGIYKGRFLAMEVKSTMGQPTQKQLNFINAVIKAGGIAGIVRSKEDVKKLLAID